MSGGAWRWTWATGGHSCLTYGPDCTPGAQRAGVGHNRYTLNVHKAVWLTALHTSRVGKTGRVQVPTNRQCFSGVRSSQAQHRTRVGLFVFFGSRQLGCADQREGAQTLGKPSQTKLLLGGRHAVGSEVGAGRDFAWGTFHQEQKWVGPFLVGNLNFVGHPISA